MKNINLSISILALIPFLFFSCENNKKAELNNFIDSASYVIGASMGSNLKMQFQEDSINYNKIALIKGIEDAVNGLDSLIFTKKDQDTIIKIFQAILQKEQAERLSKEAIANKEAGAKFFEENRKQPGVIETQSGLQYKIIKEGNGKTPTINDQVVVNYEGKFLNGKIFDSSFERKETATFPVNGVIPGWVEGLQLMKEGSSFEFYIPYNLAYGDKVNGTIPANSTLIFTVNLLKVEAGM